MRQWAFKIEGNITAIETGALRECFGGAGFRPGEVD